MSFSTIIDSVLSKPPPELQAFRRLLDPTSNVEIEHRAHQSSVLTRRHFGRTMRLFAPLYLSNECVNNCSYCAFSRSNSILRVTLDLEQVTLEMRHLLREGFRNILLVAGEHPKFVSVNYLKHCIERLKPEIPSIALEIAPMDTQDYLPLVAAGAEGLVVYQETYDRSSYQELHTAGPKKNYNWRLDTAERAYQAGFRRIGIGVLFGLSDWRNEAIALAAHLFYLQRVCWTAHITVSMPRLRPAVGDFRSRFSFDDRDFIQLLTALRLSFPHVGIVLSTRENPAFRDALAPFGFTMMSAGSHTEPGGYTAQKFTGLQHQSICQNHLKPSCKVTSATEQFSISDQRSSGEIAEMLRASGLDPVWKDWDQVILSRL